MKKILALLFLFLAMSCTTDERLDEIEELQSQIEQLLASLENSEIDSASAQAALEALQAQLSELQAEIESEIEESDDADEGKYGLTIGDDFYPMTQGYFESYGGVREDCDNNSEVEDDHEVWLELWENSLSPLESLDELGTEDNYIGSGKVLSLDIFTDAGNIEDGRYDNFINLVNDLYGTEFVLTSDAVDALYEDRISSTPIYEEIYDICFSWSGYIGEIYFDTVEEGVIAFESRPGDFDWITLNGELTFKRKNNTVTITFDGLAEESNLPVSLNFKGTLSEVSYNSSKSMNRKRRN